VTGGAPVTADDDQLAAMPKADLHVHLVGSAAPRKQRMLRARPGAAPAEPGRPETRGPRLR